MNRGFRAIIIDPFTKTVTQERIDPNLATLQGIVGGYIQVVYPECVAEESFYCDEEGKQKPNNHFMLRGWDDPFAGKCVLLGNPDRNGNDTETTWTAEEVAQHVRWLPQLDGEQLLV